MIIEFDVLLGTKSHDDLLIGSNMFLLSLSLSLSDGRFEQFHLRNSRIFLRGGNQLKQQCGWVEKTHQ